MIRPANTHGARRGLSYLTVYSDDAPDPSEKDDIITVASLNIKGPAPRAQAQFDTVCGYFL